MTSTTVLEISLSPLSTSTTPLQKQTATYLGHLLRHRPLWGLPTLKHLRIPSIAQVLALQLGPFKCHCSKPPGPQATYARGPILCAKGKPFTTNDIVTGPEPNGYRLTFRVSRPSGADKTDRPPGRLREPAWPSPAPPTVSRRLPLLRPHLLIVVASVSTTVIARPRHRTSCTVPD